MVDFISIIDASIELTKAVLFKPFSLKKWLMLCFIAFLAGTLSGGFNFNSHNDFAPKRKPVQVSQTQSLQQKPYTETCPIDLHAVKDKIFKNPKIAALVVCLILLFCCLLVFSIWLYSRFSFIFLEALTKNDASIKIPFKANRQIGNSLFVVELIVCLAFLLAFGWLIFLIFKDVMRLAVYSKSCSVGLKQILLTFLPYVFTFIALLIFSGIVSLVISDFVQIAMFKNKIKFMPAFLKTIGLISQNKGNFIVYILVKIGLSIACGIIFILLYLISLLILIIPGAIIALIFYLFYQILPHLVFFIILFIVVVPIFLAIVVFFACLRLPFAVFFRILSMKFIARLDPNYNLFRHVNPEAIS